MRQRKVKKKKKRIIGVIFAVIAIGISCFALVIQNDKDEEEKESKITYDDLRDKVVKEDEFGTGELTIDWEVLKDCNVVGWIKMGKYIDYPIVQGEDNKYYLRHSYDGSYNGNGSIFMNCNNNSDFMDLNTIIYGHNMRSKDNMFGSIKTMLDESEKNPIKFYIYTPDGCKHTYDIYSIDKVKDLGYAYKTHFDSLENFEDYKDEMKNNSEIDYKIKKNDSKTVMLSTCNSYGSASGNRVVVLGQESEVKQIQEPASWYQKKIYIEVSNKEAVCLKGNNYYYIIQDDKAIRCVKSAVDKILVDSKETVIVRVECEETEEAYQYNDISGEIYAYPIFDIINYEIE